MLGGYLLCFRYYGHGAGGVGNENGHGVTGTTVQPLLFPWRRVQFFRHLLVGTVLDSQLGRVSHGPA